MIPAKENVKFWYDGTVNHGGKMKKIGIGYENYKRIIDDGCYYIDKTLLIKDVVEKGGMVTLFTRPRRFGKTLALSMIRTFFELEYDLDGNVVDNSRYFEGKKIMEAPDEILSGQGKYPVIKLSLKSAKQPRFREAALQLRDEIVSEFDRHIYIKDSDIYTEAEKELLNGLFRPKNRTDIISEEDFRKEIERYVTALKTLSVCLKKYHGRDVIILIDEYDVPLENAYYNGFYNEMVGFIRSLFESAFKTNDSLFKAVVTGCLRISKESIFTGMNNLHINSIRESGFDEAFGFTEDETMQMLADFGIDERAPEVKTWYDGYIFGETEIYNPWSIIKYVYSIVIEKKQFPEPYWANTSSNLIIRDMVYNADDDMKEELDELINGGTIEKRVHEDITYGDINESEDNLWNFLFFTGYMKKVSERFEGRDVLVTMKIPNDEILSIYENQISSWFEKRIKEADRGPLHAAVLAGDTERIADYVSDLLEKTISTFDSAESFYHGFFLSLLYGVPKYSVKSNREEGVGRPDIVLYPNRPKDPAIIFEVKIRKRFNEMRDGIEEAFRQIRDQKYEEGILDDGYMGSIAYGICFCRKTCIVEKYSAKREDK